MLWGENRGKWKSQQLPGVEPRTPLAWATSALPLSYDNLTTTCPHNPLYVLLVVLNSSVAEHWRLKPGVSWVRLQTTASLLTFLCLRLITSKFLFPAWDKILWAFTISCVMMTIMVLCTDDSTSFQLDRHMRRLDQDLNRFTIELEADTAGITEILEQSEKAYLLFL